MQNICLRLFLSALNAAKVLSNESYFDIHQLCNVLNENKSKNFKSHITFCRWISNKKSEIDLIKIVLSEDSNSHVKTAKSWIWAMIKLTEIITKHTMAARKSCSPTDLKLFNFIFTIDECELTTRSIRCYCHFLLFIYFQIELIEFKRQKSEALVKNGSIKCVNLFLNAMC